MEWYLLAIGTFLLIVVNYAWRTITHKLNEIEQYVKAIHYRLKEKDEDSDEGT